MDKQLLRLNMEETFIQTDIFHEITELSEKANELHSVNRQWCTGQKNF